jgi:leucyl aminopeptidase
VAGVTAARVLLVGMGADEAVSEKSFMGAVSATLKAFASLGAQDAIIAFPLENVKEPRPELGAQNIVVGANEPNSAPTARRARRIRPWPACAS